MSAMGAAYGEVLSIYRGSDGDRTKALYALLQGAGPIGIVALNLFRAAKCSERAKVYRGGARDGKGSYRSQAYARKQWSMENLARILVEHADALKITWGWGIDLKQEFHQYVLYLDLPKDGQVSFHTESRGVGPDYPGVWDQQRGQTSGRVGAFVARILVSLRSN